MYPWQVKIKPLRPRWRQLLEIVRSELPWLHTRPISGVVAHHRVHAVRPVGRRLQEGHPLRGELLETLVAVVDRQAQSAHAALLQLACGARSVRWSCVGLDV